MYEQNTADLYPNNRALISFGGMQQTHALYWHKCGSLSTFSTEQAILRLFSLLRPVIAFHLLNQDFLFGLAPFLFYCDCDIKTSAIFLLFCPSFRFNFLILIYDSTVKNLFAENDTSIQKNDVDIKGFNFAHRTVHNSIFKSDMKNPLWYISGFFMFVFR